MRSGPKGIDWDAVADLMTTPPCDLARRLGVQVQSVHHQRRARRGRVLFAQSADGAAALVADKVADGWSFASAVRFAAHKFGEQESALRLRLWRRGYRARRVRS